MGIETFSIIGTGQKDLLDACTFLAAKLRPIRRMHRDDAHHALVFYSNGDEGDAFPMEATPCILAETIRQFLEALPGSAYEDQLSGYEEDFDYGWELFSPDWYSDEHQVTPYSLFAELACKPAVIERGK